MVIQVGQTCFMRSYLTGSVKARPSSASKLAVMVAEKSSVWREAGRAAVMHFSSLLRRASDAKLRRAVP